MLATQVQYWTYKENQRHNMVSENQNLRSINESVRHNVQAEQVAWQNLSLQNRALYETTRHNLATEQISQQQNKLGWSTLNETTRHNMAVESVQRTQAQAALQQAKASTLSAQAAQQQASTAFLNYASNDTVRRSQSKLNTAKAKQTRKETSYLGQKNARDWISVGSNALKSLGDVFSSIKGGKK